MGQVLKAPTHTFAQEGFQVSPHIRQMVFVARWIALIGLSHNDSHLLETAKSISQNVRGNTLGIPHQLSIRRTTGQKIPDNQKRPFIADDVE